MVRKLLLASAWLFCLTSFTHADGPLYYGETSREAWLTFSHFVEFDSTDAPGREAAMRQIDLQISHLYGSMEAAKYKAGLRNDYSILNIRIEPQAGKPGRFVAQYDFRGTIVLDSRWDRSHYDLLMPLNPERVYDAGLRKGFRWPWQKRVPCTTSREEIEEAQFYYFFSPTARDCPLKEGRDYHVVRGDLLALPNTRETYPEYERLPDSEGNIRISVLMGMHAEGLRWNPFKSRDYNTPTYRKTRKALLRAGYEKRRWSDRELNEFIGQQDAHVPLPFVEEFTKTTPRGRIVVRMFFGASSLPGGKARAFHTFLKDALENHSLLLYAGHAGYGASNDLAQIEKASGLRIRPAKDRYQIYLFNSCSSYTSYTSGFFATKSSREDPTGKRNLDIISNGLRSYFHVLHEGNIELIRAVDAWAETGERRSYQEIINRLERGYFISVAGDEDNP